MALSHRHICWKGNSLKKGTIFQSEPAIFHTQNTFLRDIFMASLNGLWKKKKENRDWRFFLAVQSKSRCGSNAWRNKVEMGKIAKSRQKLSRKIREIDWSYLCLPTVWQILKTKDEHSLETEMLAECWILKVLKSQPANWSESISGEF
jgi:hypothetical protein